MRILLLSPYDAHSHKQWRNQLQQGLPNYHWTTLTLPPRYFGWRIRSNSLTWTIHEKNTLNQSYDLIIATSMTDLSSLLGMTPSLRNIPTLLYFHENQFAYPSTQTKHHVLDAQMVTLYAAVAADQLVFNSCYNQRTFLLGVKKLLKKMPDHAPKDLDRLLLKKSLVLPVPTSPIYRSSNAPGKSTHHTVNQNGSTIKILWNHRWEHDKGPDRLYLIAQHLNDFHQQRNDIQLKLYVAGQHFRSIPDAMTALKKDFPSLIGHWGYIDNKTHYYELLNQCDIVLSTAVHDFQGLSVLEACQHGCIPVVPNRLAYPEFIPPSSRYPSFINDAHKEAMIAAKHIISIAHKVKKEFRDERCLSRPYKAVLNLIPNSDLLSQYNTLFHHLID